MTMIKTTPKSMKVNIWDTLANAKPKTERHWSVKRRKSKLVWKSKATSNVG
jgi:hypothetical protein